MKVMITAWCGPYLKFHVSVLAEMIPPWSALVTRLQNITEDVFWARKQFHNCPFYHNIHNVIPKAFYTWNLATSWILKRRLRNLWPTDICRNVIRGVGLVNTQESSSVGQGLTSFTTCQSTIVSERKDGSELARSFKQPKPLPQESGKPVQDAGTCCSSSGCGSHQGCSCFPFSKWYILIPVFDFWYPFLLRFFLYVRLVFFLF